MNKEELEFFSKNRTSEKIFEEFGFKRGENILKELTDEGFITPKDKKFKISKLGKKELEKIRKSMKKEKKKLLLKHPLTVTIFSCTLTAILTLTITLIILNLQSGLSVQLIGNNEIMVPPGQNIQFNLITIYNPTNTKVSLKNMHVRYPYGWLTKEEKNTEEGDSGIGYSIPTLAGDYTPYMVLEGGETKLMEGQFNLIAPDKEGTYKLNFYTETLDGRKYYINRKLIVKVIGE